MGNGLYFELYALLDLEPMKRFECRSIACMRGGAGDSASECNLILLWTFDLDDWK